MPHRSNGKHRFSELEPAQDTRSALYENQERFSGVESQIRQVHEALMEHATTFIKERPGMSLALAAALGGLVGWWVKRK